jgi:PAS domain S-box-containing protein
MKLSAYRISVLYVVISFLWIALSDRILFYFQASISPSMFVLINSTKGILFICFTGYSLYKLITIQNKKFAENEDQYRIIYENSPLPMWVYDLESLQIVSVNNAAVAKYGYTREDFLSKTILDIRPKEDIPAVMQTVKEGAYRPQDNMRWVHLKADGSKMHVNISSQLINFGDDRGQRVMVIADDVTEKVMFERKLGDLNLNLQREKQKLSETQQIARVAGWEFYPKIEQLVFSDEMFAITGISRPTDGSLFHHFIKHIHPDDKSKITGNLAALVYSGKQLDITYRVLLPDDSIRYIRQLAMLDNMPGQPTKIVGSAQDISELKLMEQERNKIWVNLEDTLNNINDGFYALDKKLHFTKVNKNFEIEIGLSAEQIIGKKVTEIFPGIDERPAYTHIRKVMHDKVSDKFETYSRHFQKWLCFNVYPTEEGVAVYFNDITEQRHKDQQLKEALERYDMVSMATQDIIYDLDILKNELVYNARLLPFLNLDEETEVNGRLEWWRSLIHPNDLEHVEATQRQALESGQTNWECEYRVNCGSEGYKYVFDQGYFIYDNSGEPTRLIGAIKDVNDLMLADEENRRLAEIITKVDNLIVLVDPDNKIVWVNKAFETSTGYTLNEIAGLNPKEFMIGEETSKETLAYVIESKRRQQSFTAEYLQYTKNKGKQWISAAYTPLYNDVGRYTGYISVQNIVTARKEREEQINAQNKILQEVAWLSSHEIRRPVASILGLTYLYQNSDQLTEKDEILNMIDQCANDLDSIVHNITARVNNDLSAIYIPADNFEPDVVLQQPPFK